MKRIFFVEDDLSLINGLTFAPSPWHSHHSAMTELASPDGTTGPVRCLQITAWGREEQTERGGQAQGCHPHPGPHSAGS